MSHGKLIFVVEDELRYGKLFVRLWNPMDFYLKLPFNGGAAFFTTTEI